MKRIVDVVRMASSGAMAVLLLAETGITYAAPVVVNGSFEQTIARAGNDDGNGMLATSANITGPATTPITLTGWNTTRDGIGCVVFPGTYAAGVCGPPGVRFGGSGFQAGGPGLSPDGGNFILIDGDRVVPVSTSLYQVIGGLIVGQFYDVVFYQAAAQFLDRSGDTTERWDVSLGGNPSNGITADGNIIDGQHLLSDLMMTPGGGFHSWELQSLRFQIQDANLTRGSITSQVLSFFSVGTPGGQPPIVLLDGITVNAVPEPGTLPLASFALLAAFLLYRQRTRQNEELEV